jgi:hypothetical protein
MMRPPFSWLFHKESLPWFGDQIGGSVILLHAHCHNRSARDETSYPPTNTLSVYLSYRFPFLTSLLSRESLGEASQRFHLWLLTLTNYFYPLGL